MESHLKSVYGFNVFRNYQKEIINDLLNNEDVLAILPTGGGKSLLYQFPATYTGKITIVVSPLISLMNDQCAFLNSKNIRCVCLNSESKINLLELKNNKIIYTTPEYIINNTQNINNLTEYIGLFAIDEAHCVSQWSHDFRSSYQELSIIKTQFPGIPMLVVTATAIPRVIEDIYEILNIDEVNEYLLGTRRTNLAVNILPRSEFSECKFVEPTIIYVQTRKVCDSITQQIIDKGVTCASYHGGMSMNDKLNSHNLFMKGEIMVIVATISFGMGVDKSDIRHVINYGVTNDIETYYQEIGRAGRDGINSKATMYYHPSDFATSQYLIGLSTCDKQKKIKTNALNILRQFLAENNMCRLQMIDYYFETGKLSTEDNLSKYPKCNKCDNCLGIKKQQMQDISEYASTIVAIVQKQYKTTGFYVGSEKLLKIIMTEYRDLYVSKSKIWFKDVINILISKNILNRNQLKSFGSVIGIGKKSLRECLPLNVRMDDVIKFEFATTQSNDNLHNLYDLRKKMAIKYSILPVTFINDKVILNINENKPKSLSQLWSIDGISNEFIMMYGTEFIEEYGKINIKICNHTKNKTSKLKTKDTRDVTFEYYKQSKSIKEICLIRNIKQQTIEDHILDIFENYKDVDIDLDYFGLTEDSEVEIRNAIANVGTERLRQIKDIVNKKITYGQIKLCMLLIKLE